MVLVKVFAALVFYKYKTWTVTFIVSGLNIVGNVMFNSCIKHL